MVWSNLYQYLQIINNRCQTEKALKDTVHFFKTTMIHPLTVLISNVKLEIVSKFYHVIYNYSAV